MAICKTRKVKLEGLSERNCNLLLLFKNLVVIRIKLEFSFFKHDGKLPEFERTWLAQILVTSPHV